MSRYLPGHSDHDGEQQTEYRAELAADDWSYTPPRVADRHENHHWSKQP